MSVVSRFGLHVAPGDITFLHQSSGSSNLISPDLRSPFDVQITPRRSRCPHAIDLKLEAPVPSWIDEPLAQAFVPVPHKQPTAKLLYDPTGDTLPMLEQLARLSSPTGPLQSPIWWRAPNVLRATYGLTNLGPLVWTGAEVRYCRDVEQHVSFGMAFKRQVVIVATERLPIFDRIEHVKVFDLPPDEPLEAIGATLLRRFISEHPLDL